MKLVSSIVRGSVNRKAKPSGTFSAQMRPPCASTIPLQIDSPSPVPVIRSAAVILIELIKDALQVCLGHAGTPVLHPHEQHLAVRRLRLDQHKRAFGRVFQAVAEQIGKNMYHQLEVHRDQRQVFAHLDLDRDAA